MLDKSRGAATLDALMPAYDPMRSSGAREGECLANFLSPFS